MTRWKIKCGTTAVLLVAVLLRQPEDDLEIDSESCLDTLYELLQSRFRATQASRNHDVYRQDRCTFRGSWLLLYKAIETCPSTVTVILKLNSSRHAQITDSSILSILAIRRKFTRILFILSYAAVEYYLRMGGR